MEAVRNEMPDSDAPAKCLDVAVRLQESGWCYPLKAAKGHLRFYEVRDSLYLHQALARFDLANGPATEKLAPGRKTIHGNYSNPEIEACPKFRAFFSTAVEYLYGE